MIVSNTRSEHKNRLLGLKIIRSRLWALDHGLQRSDLNQIVAKYDFPDDISYPEDINKFKTSLEQL